MRIVRLFAVVLLAMAMHAAPARAAEAAKPEKSLKETFVELLPDMGNPESKKFQEAQQAWQEICFAAGTPGQEAQRAEVCKLMCEKLGAATPAAAKIWLLKQLERIGRDECVDAIAPLLDDSCPLVRGAARCALTNCPSPRAIAPLRAKMTSTADAEFKVGLINSLGTRADRGSTAALAKELAASKPSVAVAAARALGKIGTPEAGRALAATRPKATGELRLWIDDSYLLVADELVRADKMAEAAAIFKCLADPAEPQSIRMAAFKGVLQTAGRQTADVISTALAGRDKDARDNALAFLLSRNCCCGDVMKVTAGLGKLPPDAQVALLVVLGSKRYKPALPTVLAAAKSADEKVKIAAIGALAGLGDVSVVPLLIETMAAGGDVGAAAQASLETMFADGVDEKLLQTMKGATDPVQRALFIELLERRRAAVAVPALLEEALSKDVTIRRRAMSALALLAGEKDVAAMIRALLAIEKPGIRSHAEQAITLVCGRIRDEANRADPVLAVYNTLDAAGQEALLLVIGRIGCPKTRGLIRNALASKDDKRYDAGFGALCNWPDIDSAEELLGLFEKPKDAKHRMPALRAFARAIGDPRQGSADKKLAMLKQAMRAASRDEERLVILDRAPAARHIETLRWVLPMVDDPVLSPRACRVICDLAHHNELRGPNKAEFVKALDRVLAVSKNSDVIQRAKTYKAK